MSFPLRNILKPEKEKYEKPENWREKPKHRIKCSFTFICILLVIINLCFITFWKFGTTLALLGDPEMGPDFNYEEWLQDREIIEIESKILFWITISTLLAAILLVFDRNFSRILYSIVVIIQTVYYSFALINEIRIINAGYSQNISFTLIFIVLPILINIVLIWMMVKLIKRKKLEKEIKNAPTEPQEG